MIFYMIFINKYVFSSSEVKKCTCMIMTRIKYTFFSSYDIHIKYLDFLFTIFNLKAKQIFCTVRSHKIIDDVISMVTLHNVPDLLN